MITLWLLSSLSWATPGFDPSLPAARYTDTETYTHDGAVRLWSAIERLEDPDRTLLTPDAFNGATEWPENVAHAPHIRACFGTARPGTHAALLHMGPSESMSEGTPILMVHGAGDNGSRSFVTMATRLDRSGRPVYAITFAHPQGDVFKHAELIADAIARIKFRTGAEQVDLVAHSKGGVSAAIYLSNQAGQDWGNDAYEAVGTPYQGDVRRAVFIASPLAGTDTMYRWTGNNYGAVDADAALAPSSWSTYYPLGSSYWWNAIDLSDQDHLSDGEDLFPGQRQILARQPHTLPGANPMLGSYAWQQDWYTTYEGGFGFYSYSEGIDAAIEDGGDVIARLEDAGVDPEVELYILAGNSAVLSVGIDWVDAVYGEAYGDIVGSSLDTWAEFIGAMTGDGLLGQGITQDEVVGLARGDLLLGEITGESDGVVFTSSATHAEALTARGAVVQETRIAELSHLDLLYASEVTGQLLIAQSEVEGGRPWKRAFGERYVRENTLGWVETVLADDQPDTTGEPDSASGLSSDDPEPEGTSGDPGYGCSTAPGAPAWFGLFATAALLIRRRRR